jgi:antitoxin (DNA-binding transcriptional repressor) of toxin-antitoxin stability system
MVYNRLMVRLNVHEAKTHLSRHLERLVEGEEDVIVLCKRNVPIAEIRALPKARAAKRPIGLAKGKVRIPKSFFDPLPDDLLAAFSGESG